MDLLTSKYIDAENRLLNPYALDIEPSDGDRAFVTGYVEAKGVDEGGRAVSGMASTENVDRYEEIIKAQAYEDWLGTFMDNPQFLASHKMAGFDAAQATNIGQWTEVQVRESVGLWGTAKFLEPGDALADSYWERYRQRAMRAFSVGGIVHEWEMTEFEMAPGVKKRLRVITNFELMEISAVTVPANREALIRVASAAAAGGVAKIGGTDVTELVGEVRSLSEKLSPDTLAIAVRREITQHLNTDPGGPLACLIQDVVEACQAPRDHHRDDVQPTTAVKDAATLDAIGQTLKGLKHPA